MSEWISVTERLPEPRLPELATFRAHARNKVIRAEYSDGKSLEMDPDQEMVQAQLLRGCSLERRRAGDSLDAAAGRSDQVTESGNQGGWR